MPTKVRQKKSPEIKAVKFEFKIFEIRIRKFFENDYKENGLQKKDLNRGRHKIGVTINIDPDEGTLTVHLDISFVVDSEVLYGIISMHKFKIRYFKKRIPGEDGNYPFPDAALKDFVSIALGGTRGMIAASHKNPVYSDYFLPLIDIPDIIRKIKTSHKGDVMEDRILLYLMRRPKGTASSEELFKDLELDISNKEFDSIAESLYSRGFIFKPHKQSRTYTAPDYDQLIITDKGKEYVSEIDQ